MTCLFVKFSVQVGLKMRSEFVVCFVQTTSEVTPESEF